MLESIKEFFLSFGNILKSLVDFVIGLIEDIVSVVKLVGTFVLKIPDFFSWLPAQVIALIVAAFSVVVIYKILGREG